ncbi:MAG TPA: HD domain-containing protein [Phycisphaerales bacterium]|nr:HD domain-containing protein [Phycisphaerales bacterium]
MDIGAARALMHAWVENPALRTHMEAVGSCMRHAALRHAPGANAGEIERWAVAGILHDFDYERHPGDHPLVGAAHLESLGVDSEIREAILGHFSEKTGVERRTPMARALFAVDELAGFIVACAKVRPDGLATLEPKSVVKKLKQPAFAAAVSREDIAKGVEELGVDRDEHVAMCIAAIRGCEQVRL